MPDLVLATLNAQYIHASFGLRYLLANLGPLRERACLAEFVIKQQPLEIAEAILALEPRIVGLGVYIWNVAQTAELVALLKRLRPELVIILGGPEVSYEAEGQEIVRLADHVIAGEADLKFAGVCGEILAGRGGALPKIMAAELPDLNQLELPYSLYSAEDIAQRVIYVEASRGCPFSCEFCLSSLDIPVRAFPLTKFLESIQTLLDRGARHFKFVDRTFNLHLASSISILEFFLNRWREGMFLHFEMIPDRFPDELRALIRRFPPGSVQFEVGIQSFDETALANISRRQNVARVEDNLRFLREEAGVHVHADLIVGLPGEGMASFGRGFDRLLRMGPQEIQVGILKRLRGAPIARHDERWRMIYSPHPPYEILATRDIPFPEMQRMKRFARYWDLLANSGNFRATLDLLWHQGVSPFEEFLQLSDWLYQRLKRAHGIALHVLARGLFDYLTGIRAIDPDTAAAVVEGDWHRAPSREALNLRKFSAANPVKAPGSGVSRRQERHARNTGETGR